MISKKRNFSALIYISWILISSPSEAQTAISNDGVIFPDDSKQTSAVILPADCPHSEAIVWDSNAENWVCESDLSQVSYAIGDTGPAGGKVFYVTDGGLNGLEAAPDEQGITEWGCAFTEIPGAAGTVIGAGAQNTTAILVECYEFTAARIANFYSLNGFNDWFVPSKDELNQLYLNRAAIGGIVDAEYWSSSESSFSSAWCQDFSDGVQSDSSKSETLRIRPIRAF